MAAKVFTPEFRASYAHVWQPKAMAEGTEPKYSISMIFHDGTDLTALRKAAEEAAVAKWGEDKKKWPKNLRSPFRNGDDERPDDAAYAGSTFVNASSKTRPGIVIQNGDSIDPCIDQEEFYSGCYAIATLSCFAYDQAGNKGISFGLNNIMKTRDGEPLGGGKARAEDDFAMYAGGGNGGGKANAGFM